MPIIHKITLDDVVFPLGYRVVTLDLKSLGLRNNPHILQYPINEWFFLAEDQVKSGVDDWGGIWVARTMGRANGIMNYMKKQYDRDTRLFYAALDEILFANNYRIKTNGINMFEEIQF